MIAAKITNTRLALAELAGRVSEDDWKLVKRIQAELDCAAHMAERLESTPLAVDCAPRILRPIRQQPESSAPPRLRLIVNNPQKGETHV